MSLWKRFSNWWWGIPKQPLQQDEHGNTVIWPLDTPIHTKLWLLIRPALTSIYKFVAFVTAVIIAGIIGGFAFESVKALIGTG